MKIILRIAILLSFFAYAKTASAQITPVGNAGPYRFIPSTQPVTTLEGTVYQDSSTHIFMIYNGSGWVAAGSGISGAICPGDGTTALKQVATNDLGIYTGSAVCVGGTLKFDVSATQITASIPFTSTGTIFSNGGSLETAATGIMFFNTRAVIGSSADGKVQIGPNAGTTGVTLNAATDGTLRVGTFSDGALGTILANSYSLALTTATPADQTGNATATLKMNGLGAAGAPCTITPTSTGRVIFTITGDIGNATTGDGVSLKLVYGTGAAPANAAAATGTQIGASRATWVALTGMLTVPWAITASATGLAVATAVWYDLQIADVTGGTATIKNVTCTANEI